MRAVNLPSALTSSCLWNSSRRPARRARHAQVSEASRSDIRTAGAATPARIAAAVRTELCTSSFASSEVAHGRHDTCFLAGRRGRRVAGVLPAAQVAEARRAYSRVIFQELI